VRGLRVYVARVAVCCSVLTVQLSFEKKLRLLHSRLLKYLCVFSDVAVCCSDSQETVVWSFKMANIIASDF